MEETANKEVEDQQQDFIVLPGQKWLDGICVAPGVVRQFVAMPRTFLPYLLWNSADGSKWDLDTPSKVKRHQKSSMEGFNLRSRRNFFQSNACGRTVRTNIS